MLAAMITNCYQGEKFYAVLNSLFKNQKKNHLCLNCIYLNQKEPNLPRCDVVGVLGTAAGLTGLIAAQLSINFFTNNHENVEKLILIGSKLMRIDYISIKQNENCIYNKK